MNIFKRIFVRNNKPEVEKKIADKLIEQTDDAAFLHKTNWIVAFGKKDFKTAINELNKALVIAPNNAEFFSLRAMTHYSLGNYDEMIYDLKSSININPNQKEAKEFLESLKAEAIQLRDKSRKLASENKLDEAISLINKAVGIEPENLFNYYFRGILYSQLDNLDKAIKDLKYVSSIDENFEDTPQILQALLNMAKPVEQKLLNNSEYFCFVCCGNSSLIASFYDSFKSAGLNLQMDKYSIDANVLSAKCSDAKSLELSFKGTKFFAKKEESIDKFEDFINQMSFAASQSLYIFYVEAQGEMYLRVQLFYNSMLSQAVNQGILPFPMFVTQNADAKKVLIEILK